MGSTITLGNIVGVAKNILLKAVIPLQGDFDTCTIFTISVEVHNFINGAFVGIQILNKGPQATFIGINFFFA